MGVLVKMLERRDSLSVPSQWLIDWFGGGTKTKTGVKVTEMTAMQSSAVWACVKLLSGTLASLPLPVYKRLQPKGKERDPSHRLYRILHDQANDEMTSFTWREMMMAHLVLWGNCYSYIQRDPAGRITGLIPIHPDRCEPYRTKEKSLAYKIHLPDGADRQIAAWEIFHVPGLGFDGLKGYSPIKMMMETVGLALATEEFAARFYGQGANIGGVFELPATLSPEAHDNLKKDLEEKYNGLSKAHTSMLLEEGMKYTPIGIPPEQAQFIESRKFGINEIARIFGIQPHLIAELTESTNNNIEMQSLEFVIYSLRPWLVRWEQVINWKLFFEEEKTAWFAEFLIDGLLRGDFKSRQEGLQIQRRNGIINGDDWCEIENKNPMPGKIGGIYIVESNMQSLEYLVENPGGAGNKPKTDANQTNSLKKAYERLFFDAFDRIFKREIDGFEVKKDSPEAENWLEKHYKNMPEYMESSLFSLIVSWNEAQKPINEDFEAKTRAFLKDFAQKHVKNSIEILKTAEKQPDKWPDERIRDEIKELMNYE
ncbi:MAG: phage portal protein [Candidatus Babeliales bacterium]|jgi:HK97 family phage portal protein